jgi:hypothetical protein
MSQNPLMNEYLKQQQQQHVNSSYKPQYDTMSEVSRTSKVSRRIEQVLVDVPDNTAMEEFKHQVKMWMDVDNQIKQLSQSVREKRVVQRALTDKILLFMSKYNVEDLNTKEGTLRYKVTQSKPTVKTNDVKTKLYNYFEHDKETADKVVQAVFSTEDTPKKEKVSLRRLKGVRVMNV